MLIIELGAHYSGKSYNIISKNCNHFGDEFAKRLCGKGIPGWINRLAFFGKQTMVQFPIFPSYLQFFIRVILFLYYSCR